MRFTSAIYEGIVRHKRHRPQRHQFSYKVFSVLLDIDELPVIHRRCRFFSHNRFNLFSFFDRDHGPGKDAPLRPYVESHLARANIDIAGGKILLLCYPRILGYVFNPLSVYFAYHGDGRLTAILYEVSNTFGEKHTYLLPVNGGRKGHIKHATKKLFFVSPFMDVTGRYEFTIRPPDETVGIVIHQSDRDGDLFDAAFAGNRRSISDKNWINLFLRYPLMTLKVIIAIHWQALRLWRKGVPVVKKPAPPAHTVTVVPPAGGEPVKRKMGEAA